MEVAESVTTTGSRNPSPSLPEGANVSLEPEEAPMEVEKESSSTLASNQATISPLVTHQTSAVGGEACKKEEKEGASGEREKSVESERSSECSSVKEGAVVTEAMLKEEQRLHNTESRESSSERDKVLWHKATIFTFFSPFVFFTLAPFCSDMFTFTFYK